MNGEHICCLSQVRGEVDLLALGEKEREPVSLLHVCYFFLLTALLYNYCVDGETEAQRS